jgi:putative hemolysin
VLKGVPAITPYAAGLALLVVTLLLSLATIIFGELVPKTLALAHAERFALTLSRPIGFLDRALRPVVWMLTQVTEAVSRLLGVRHSNVEDQMSTEELKLLVERGGEQGILEAEEEQMISAVMELGESRVHEVMIPRIDMVAVPATSTIDELVDVIVEKGHSRVPVYERSADDIVGILYAKDLLPYLKGPDHMPAIRSLLRTPLFVPESMSIDDLLHVFQRNKVHIAIVLDEYGGTAGLVTIEDLIEEIVGEIQDEYDVEDPMIVPLGEDEARVDGRCSVDDLAKHFEVTLEGDDSEQYDTVGGLIYHEIGGVPRPGDTVTIDRITLTVESTDGRRVSKVLARREPREEPPAEADADE